MQSNMGFIFRNLNETYDLRSVESYAIMVEIIAKGNVRMQAFGRLNSTTWSAHPFWRRALVAFP